jgi:tRNA-modifying protein YgfZ
VGKGDGVIMSLYHMNYVVLRFSGDVEKLLTGITSNTLTASQNAFLDRFGKIIAVVWQCWDKDTFLIVVARTFLERVKLHLAPYLHLTGVKMEHTSLFVYWDLEGNATSDFVIHAKKGNIILHEKEYEATVSDDAFVAFRLEHNIPLQGIDYDQEMALNVSEDFISFTKGCYLGQEVIARVKNLSKAPKKLVVEEGKFVFVKNE